MIGMSCRSSAIKPVSVGAVQSRFCGSFYCSMSRIFSIVNLIVTKFPEQDEAAGSQFPSELVVQWNQIQIVGTYFLQLGHLQSLSSSFHLGEKTEFSSRSYANEELSPHNVQHLFSGNVEKFNGVINQSQCCVGIY